MPRKTNAVPVSEVVSDVAPVASAPAAPRSFSLYELSEEQRELDRLLDEADGELTPELEARYDAFTRAMASKPDGYGEYFRMRELACDNLEAEEKRLNQRRKAIRAHLDRLEAGIGFALHAMGRKKIEGERFDLVLSESESVEVKGDIELLPEQFVRVVPASLSPDKKAIGAALRAGEEVPGCSLKTTLRGKVK